MDRPGVLELLAVGETPDGDLEVPNAWAGRVSLGRGSPRLRTSSTEREASPILRRAHALFEELGLDAEAAAVQAVLSTF